MPVRRLALAGLAPFAALACTMPASAQTQIQTQTPAQAPAAQASPQRQGPTSWEKMPRMDLQETFAGPLRDTIIQRWKDGATGATCYLYLPINVPHSAPTPSGYVQYGAATVGSISCLPGEPAKPAAPARR